MSLEPVCNLGVQFDDTLSRASHVNNVVKCAHLHLRTISRIRSCLTQDTAKLLTQSLVLSRLDYCNSLLAFASEQLLHKLQLTQNCAARVVTRTRRYEHITPILQDLHWLPVKEQIVFKVLLFVYKCLHGDAPKYLTSLLLPYEPGRSLRSEGKSLLHVPRYHLETYGGKSFSVLGTQTLEQS